MAVTVTNPESLPYRIDGAQKRSRRRVALDSSYPTGGESVTAAELGLNNIDDAKAYVYSVATTTVNVANASAQIQTGSGSIKVLLYDETPAEIANTADVAGLVVEVEARGY